MAVGEDDADGEKFWGVRVVLFSSRSGLGILADTDASLSSDHPTSEDLER